MGNRHQVTLRRFEGTPVAMVTRRDSLGPPPLIDWGGYSWAPSRLSLDSNRLGIHTPDLPSWITPEQAVAAAQAWAKAEQDRVGEAVKTTIREALAETGIDRGDRWMYFMVGHHHHGGRRLLRMVAYQPVAQWSLPYEDLGNVVARELLMELPDGSRYGEGKYDDYAFDVFGLALRSRAAAEGLPERVALAISEDAESGPDGQIFSLAAYRVRAFHAASPIVGTANWRPGQSAVSTGSYGGTLGHDESHIAKRGLDLFYEIEYHRPGMSDEEAFEEAVEFGLEWLADNPSSEPADFGRKQFTAKRCTGPDATDKWMKDKHFGIRQVQRELQRRLRRSA